MFHYRISRKNQVVFVLLRLSHPHLLLSQSTISRYPQVLYRINSNIITVQCVISSILSKSSFRSHVLADFGNRLKSAQAGSSWLLFKTIKFNRQLRYELRSRVRNRFEIKCIYRIQNIFVEKHICAKKFTIKLCTIFFIYGHGNT